MGFLANAYIQLECKAAPSIIDEYFDEYIYDHMCLVQVPRRTPTTAFVRLSSTFETVGVRLFCREPKAEDVMSKIDFLLDRHRGVDKSNGKIGQEAEREMDSV